MKKILAALWDVLPLKRILLEPMRRLGIVPEAVYRHLHFKGVFTARVNDTQVVLQSYGDRLENEIFWSGIFGRWEGEALRLWTAVAEDAHVILDVGANSGVFALAGQAVNSSATILAFEPIDRIFRRLERNVELNGRRVHCFRVAVTDHGGTTTIYDPGGENAYASSLDPAVFGESTGVGWEPRTVPCMRLDQLLSTMELTPDLLKIDVEGHELNVLRGLGGLLHECRPTLLVEVLTEKSAEGIWELIDGLGYEAYQIDEASGPAILRPGSSPTAGRNVLFCTTEVAERLDLRG